MVYDSVGVFDYFSKVDHNTIICLVNGKSAIGKSQVGSDCYYFDLGRSAEFNENIA